MDIEVEDYEVICIGAGFSGLVAAHTLLKSKPELKLCVVEAKDRVGGRTCLQTLKCADEDGNECVHQWEMGGMWVGSSQQDIMELLKELDIATYKQYTTGMKCMQLEGEAKARTYSSDLPPIGILSTVDFAQLSFKMDKLIKSIDPADPYSHPEAAALDAMTLATFLDKYSWTAKVKDILHSILRASSGVESAQASALYFLTAITTAGSLSQVLETSDGGAQESKIEGGSQAVCIKLIADYIGWDRVKLSSPVSEIAQIENGVLLTCKTGKKYRAQHVIMALPPDQILKIDISPPLPNSKLALYKMMPAGHIIKIIITYPKPYWKLNGYSGEFVAIHSTAAMESGPLAATLDATSEHGHPALVAFIGGDQAVSWGDKSVGRYHFYEERRQAILSSLASMFKCKEMLEPIDYQEKDWSKETYNGGCPGNIVTPGAMKFYSQGLTEPFDRLEFSGTESSEIWCGYISGAVYAGKRAATNVLKKLNK